MSAIKKSNSVTVQHLARHCQDLHDFFKSLEEIEWQAESVLNSDLFNKNLAPDILKILDSVRAKFAKTKPNKTTTKKEKDEQPTETVD